MSVYYKFLNSEGCGYATHPYYGRNSYARRQWLHDFKNGKNNWLRSYLASHEKKDWIHIDFVCDKDDMITWLTEDLYEVKVKKPSKILTTNVSDIKLIKKIPHWNSITQQKLAKKCVQYIMNTPSVLCPLSNENVGIYRNKLIKLIMDSFTADKNYNEFIKELHKLTDLIEMEAVVDVGIPILYREINVGLANLASWTLQNSHGVGVAVPEHAAKLYAQIQVGYYVNDLKHAPGLLAKYYSHLENTLKYFNKLFWETLEEEKRLGAQSSG